MSQPHAEDASQEPAANDPKDSDFLEWCQDTGNDPHDPGSREVFDEHQAEIEAETGDAFWEGLSPEDRDGYESMMTDD